MTLADKLKFGSSLVFPGQHSQGHPIAGAFRRNGKVNGAFKEAPAQVPGSHVASACPRGTPPNSWSFLGYWSICHVPACVLGFGVINEQGPSHPHVADCLL